MHIVKSLDCIPNLFGASLALICALSAPLAAASPSDKKIQNLESVLEHSLKTIILPGYQQLQISAEKLAQTITTQCHAEQKIPAKSVFAAFKHTLSKWQYVQSQHLAPIETAQRYSRIYFWPDKRGRLGKQLQKVIARQAEDVTRSDSLSQKSVALQGLPALERLLFKPYKTSPQFTCNFTKSIAQNISQIASDILSDWHKRETSPVQELLALRQGPTKSYDTPKDLLQDIYRDIITNLTLITDYKLNVALIQKDTKLKLYLMESRFSQSSFQNIQANIAFIQDMTLGISHQTGFTRFITNTRAREIVTEKFQSVSHALSPFLKTDYTDEQISHPETQQALTHLQTAVRHLRESLIEHLLPYLDIDLGFNALDGD